MGQRLNSEWMRIVLYRRQFLRTAAGGALSGLRGGALIPPLVGLRVAWGADVAHWVAEQGGIVQTDASSRITGVNLGFSLVTDADLEMLAGLKDLRKLDL